MAYVPILHVDMIYFFQVEFRLCPNVTLKKATKIYSKA